jgi:hypothetical protein
MDEDGEGVTFASGPTALLLASHGSTSAQQLQDRLKVLAPPDSHFTAIRFLPSASLLLSSLSLSFAIGLPPFVTIISSSSSSVVGMALIDLLFGFICLFFAGAHSRSLSGRRC